MNLVKLIEELRNECAQIEEALNGALSAWRAGKASGGAVRQPE
jgi:hypothetical protein